MHQSVVELETVNYITEDKRLIEDYLLEITGAAVVMAEVRRRNRQFPHIYLTPFPLRTSVSSVVKAFVGAKGKFWLVSRLQIQSPC